MRSRILDIAAWFLLLCWVGIVWLGLTADIVGGELPPDWLTYERATQALSQQEEIYPTVQEARATWLQIHRLEAELTQTGSATSALQRIGPYLYPPTLALLIARTQLYPTLWIAALSLALLSFTALWLRATQAAGRGVLLVVGALSSTLAIAAGNVELLLLTATLGAAWLWWQQKVWWAVAGMIALTLLIKPFYALFWISWTLVWLATIDKIAPPALARRYMFRVGLLTILLIALEVTLWEPAIRGAAFAYFSDALAYQWFTLPLAQQTPMSIWNRTFMQALINAGVGAEAAQIGSWLLWGVGTLITVRRVRESTLTFSTAFALCFVLLYMGRPVGWGFVFLEFVVVLAAWPTLTKKQQAVLLVATLALMLSRWLALVLTAQGRWLRLMTLQSAQWPWESWLVLPACWLVLLYATSRRSPNA